jgi:hypothetical protein
MLVTLWSPSPHNYTAQKTPTHNVQLSVEKHLRLVEVQTRTYDGRSISFVRRPSSLSQLLWGDSCAYQYSSPIYLIEGRCEWSLIPKDSLIRVFTRHQFLAWYLLYDQCIWAFLPKTYMSNLFIITSLTKSTGSLVDLSPWQSSPYACHLHVFNADGRFVSRWTAWNLPL